MGFESVTIPAWNLFWLSNPQLDKVPGSGNRWYQHYRPVAGMLTAVYRDITSDSTLRGKLSQHPLLFLEWYERQTHKTMDLYRSLAGPNWVQTVTARAQEASDRMITQAPPVIITGNVIKVDFRRAA